MSLAHSRYLTQVKSCAEYDIPIVSLNGIGGRTLPITRAGILSHIKPNGRIVKFLCYVFDTPVGNTSEILLLGLKTIVESNIDIRYPMALSGKGQSKMVRFVEDREGYLLHDGKYKQNSGRVEVLHFKIVEIINHGK